MMQECELLAGTPPSDLTYGFNISLNIGRSYLHNTRMREQKLCTVHPRIVCHWWPLVSFPCAALCLWFAFEAAIPCGLKAVLWSSVDVAFPGAPVLLGLLPPLKSFGRRRCVCFGFDFFAYIHPKNAVFWCCFLACSAGLDGRSRGVELAFWGLLALSILILASLNLLESGAGLFAFR
jgi:hypothetical protein